MKKRSALLLIAGVLGILYLLYSVSYWTSVNDGSGTAEAIGAGIATAIVFPHLICAGVAVISNVLAFFMRHRAFALVAGILYSVAMILFPLYFMFTVIQAILCYIAFARMKKENKHNQKTES